MSLDALGPRAKVGVLVPFTNTIVQPELDAMRPTGVTNHVARMEPSSRGLTIGDMDAYRRSLQRGIDHITRALDQVLPAEPRVVILGHSIDTFRGGVAGAAALRMELERHTHGVPIILPAESFVSALKVLVTGRRIGVLTPYWPPGDEQVRSFFQDAGYEVLRIIGLCSPGPLAIARTPAADSIAALTELARDKPDAIVQPGTNLATGALAGAWSARLGVPILSCNTAMYWQALRSIGIGDRIGGFGALLEEH